MQPVGHMIELQSASPATAQPTPAVEVSLPPLVLRVTVRCPQRRHRYVHLPVQRAQVSYAHASPWLTPGAFRCRR